MDINPIRSNVDHADALEVIERLWGADPDTEEGRALEVLVTLANAYEEQHHEIENPGPIDAIIFRLEQLGLERKDLEPYIGSRGRVSEILSGKRALSLAMIRRLRDGLGIPADVLIGSSESESNAA